MQGARGAAADLYFFPLPHGQGSLRPALDFAAIGLDRRGGKGVAVASRYGSQ